MTRMKYSLLAIDGGGIRGVIPARVLEEIENRLDSRICEVFDLVAGTSTGGIIALGVAKPDRDGQPQFKASDLADLYVEHGAEIFQRSLWRKVHTGWGVVNVRYPTKPLETLLQERFGQTLLSEALTEVVIPTYDLSGPGPFFFKRRYGQEDPSWNVKMWEAARATSAAPTYFEPARVPSLRDGREHALVDGGVFANNPGVAAYSEAIRNKLHEKWSKDAEIYVVSIGTGQPPMDFEHPGPIPVRYEKARHWGFLKWARPGLDVVFDGIAKATDHEMRKLCSHDSALDYKRLQSPLPTASHAMDDASRANIERLEKDAAALVRENSADLDEICEKLKEIAADRAGVALIRGS